MKTEVDLAMPDGSARAFVFHPEGEGPWPGIIFFMDGPGIRPGLFEMCERLASHGYYVLLPDMFWRLGPYDPIDLKALKDNSTRQAIFARLFSSTDLAKQYTDTEACLEFLAVQPKVKGQAVGVAGYCFGGAIALRAAANFPHRVVAVGSFHGGNLATDSVDSPHLLAPRIRARVYVAGADNDASFPPEQADRLRNAFDSAHVSNVVTIYKGAGHGYAPHDLAAYHREASEQHWTELLRLVDETLKT
jgi:carboxymethylenebutenolidase